MAYSSTILSNWSRFLDLTSVNHKSPIAIDGASLDLAGITALARYNKRAEISSSCIARVQQSAEDVTKRLSEGDTLYGTNTGVGASANTRTDAVDDLQQAIIKILNCGIIDDDGTSNVGGFDVSSSHSRDSRLPIHDTEKLESLPITWAKAAHLVRVNSLAGGNSGIRTELLRSLERLLQADIVPRMPLRGSISASGDLSPLAYLAGVAQGNPGIQVWTRKGSKRVLTSADRALKEADLHPITYAPKEALAIANGTSVSAAAAALAMHDAHGCMVLAQILTAMNVEGLNGTVESFDPYISDVRPHPGQQEASRNIRGFLRGSRLARKAGTENTNGLKQDRYSLRTAPQWLSAELENMLLAHQQVLIECNSVTDNPLVKNDGSVLQGGNFQASAVTSAMDKARSALQAVGRMVFQQTSELMNPSMNNGLPPNLTADEPSRDFLFKGMDIASASYQSELAMISHGFTPFVMSAELGNQSINSMALASARYTHTAITIFMQICANSFLAVCQALDLRAIQHDFEEVFEPIFRARLHSSLYDIVTSSEQLDSICTLVWSEWISELRQRPDFDLRDRVRSSTSSSIASMMLLDLGSYGVRDISAFCIKLREWAEYLDTEAIVIRERISKQHTMEDTMPLLSSASQRMYRFIRQDLEVPFLRNGSPAPQNMPSFHGTEVGTTIGTFTSRIFRAIRDGRLFVPAMQCLREVGDITEDTEQTTNDDNSIHAWNVGKDAFPSTSRATRVRAML